MRVIKCPGTCTWQLELRNFYLSRDIKSVSELYGQRTYKNVSIKQLNYKAPKKSRAIEELIGYNNYNKLYETSCGKKKSKSVPLPVWSGPEGSRKLRFPHFMTTAQNVGKVVSPTHRPPLPPGNTPGTHFC
jgi:hypothetical protein